MRDITFGSLSRNQLHLRLFAPAEMSGYDNAIQWRFNWRRLLSPSAWRRAIRNKWNWRFHFKICHYANHRCYCEDGGLCDGSIVLAGFGLQWFFSHYRGPIPCWCDKAIDEVFGTEES